MPSKRRRAAAIRAFFDQEGELSAAIELRRRFPGITDNAKARACARSIAGWTPLPVQPRAVTRLRPRKDSLHPAARPVRQEVPLPPLPAILQRRSAMQ